MQVPMLVQKSCLTNSRPINFKFSRFSQTNLIQKQNSKKCSVSFKKINCVAEQQSESQLQQEEQPIKTDLSENLNNNTQNNDLNDSIPKSQEWQLDFCSRPLLDERNKKVWEILICSPDKSFQFSTYVPNNKINSQMLKGVISEILSKPGAVKPEKCLFFRGQMKTIISRALDELQIKPSPSRRCFSLMQWLEDRVDSVYKQDPRYDEKAVTVFQLDLGSPQDIPEQLRGEAWEFVKFPLSALQEELKTLDKSSGAFGKSLSLEQAGCGDLSQDTEIPGITVFSRRALPLAAWTNGFEIACIKADTERACLLLETGVMDRWRYGSYPKIASAAQEALEWEKAKHQTKGLHFLAIMETPDDEECAGIWLLQDVEPPSI
eukprot:TRINITY_DN29714_c0_g1_i3.p1 TRINITY_DN29714_c0_g1~~TRINITY_DN29714_c0_g1_i3.p1  ORF type:complete len:377 (+),score=47.74 TRINITY_DN29714_c0_g1_i3:29-1159(+)